MNYKGYEILINVDENPENPRTEWDNLGTMVCFHKRYSLGDKTNFSNDLDGFKSFLKREDENIISLPLYLYDHSGITMNTTGFRHCDGAGWDWGQVGVIYVTKAHIRKEYGWKYITKARAQKILDILRNEVQTYDDYLTGEVYGYSIKDSINKKEETSCWGYYGSDHEKSGLMPDARSAIDGIITYQLKTQGIQTELNLAA